MSKARMMFSAMVCAGTLLMGSATVQAIAVTDVIYEGANADDARLVAGNDSTGAINDLFGPSWSQLLKTDETDTGSFGDVEFRATGLDPGSTSGDFTLSWEDTAPVGDLPLVLDMVLVLKASDQFGAYLFELVEFDDQGGNMGSGDGEWKIAFTNNGDNTPDLSHASIYLRESEAPPDERIPVPGTLLLLGAGLVVLRRRIRQQAPAH